MDEPEQKYELPIVSRPGATPQAEGAYNLDIEEVVQIFKEDGFPYSDRTVQRYCNGTQGVNLDFVKVPTDNGPERWKVSEQSVKILISHLKKTRRPLELK